MGYRTDASMKCVCGYEYEEYLHDDHGDLYATKGDEEFLELAGPFHHIRHRHGYHSEHIPVKLYACPKCGTVRIQG